MGQSPPSDSFEGCRQRGPEKETLGDYAGKQGSRQSLN